MFKRYPKTTKIIEWCKTIVFSQHPCIERYGIFDNGTFRIVIMSHIHPTIYYNSSLVFTADPDVEPDIYYYKGKAFDLGGWIDDFKELRENFYNSGW